MTGKGSGHRKGWTSADQRKAPRRLVVRERRKQSKLTLDEVAQKLGISLHQYSRYELNPNRFRHEHLAILARLFSCSVDELIEPNDVHMLPLASVRRTVPVYKVAGRGDMSLTDMTVSPRSTVGTSAYALEAPDNTMAANGGSKAICAGDICVVDPAAKPDPGDIVHAIDPHTGKHVLRFFVPLHPTNPRAPGFLLRAADPSVDEIYVAGGGGVNVIKGRVMGRVVLL